MGYIEYRIDHVYVSDHGYTYIKILYIYHMNNHISISWTARFLFVSHLSGSIEGFVEVLANRMVLKPTENSDFTMKTKNENYGLAGNTMKYRRAQ